MKRYVSIEVVSTKIHSSQTFIAYKLNGAIPECACGCGTPLRWTNKGFQTYIRGHIAKINNPMSGQTHSSEAKQNISQKRKAKFASGEMVVWNKIDTPEIRAKCAAAGLKNTMVILT